MSEQPYMMFEIREKVKHSKDGKSFNSLSSLELEPIIKVYEKENQIEVAGYLVLNGEFQKEQEDWEEQFEQADGLHYGDFFNKQEYEHFQYQIPISFDIQRGRVKDIADVFVVVDQFDYEVQSDEEMELTANVKLIGVHPNVLQDKPVDLKYSENASKPNEEDFSFKNDGFIQHETEKDVEEASTPSSYLQEELEEKAEEDGLDEERNEEVLEENQVDEVREVEAEEVTSELESEEVEEKELSQSSPTMKIGIKGQNKERPTKEESKSNPLYSLLHRDKKESKTDVPQAPYTEEEHQDMIDDVQEEKRVDDVENQTVVSMEDYMKDRETTEEENEEINFEDEDEDSKQSSAKANTTTSQTKDMLFSLLKGDDASNKFKLKMYLVQKNESLEEIADRYDVNVSELIKNNNLDDHSIEAGQILYLPREG